MSEVPLCMMQVGTRHMSSSSPTSRERSTHSGAVVRCHAACACCSAFRVHGYLAHMEAHPPRIQKKEGMRPYGGPRGGGERLLMREAPLLSKVNLPIATASTYVEA